MFDPKGIDEVTLELVHDADQYVDKMFSLNFTDGDGRQMKAELDGIQIGDIIADAKAAGLPVEWPYPDGVPRRRSPDNPNEWLPLHGG